MAQARNTFIKSKLNKDLDARLMPQGEYRDALNVQVSKSEGSSVGSLENVLGTTAVLDIQTALGINDLACIGQLVDESNSDVYLFLTDSTTDDYDPADNNFIIRVSIDGALNSDYEILVKGAFLNFSNNHKIYASNLLEGLLFWTDNYNQPRVINTTIANPDNLPIPTYYQTEDQISVAKYNPYESIELWQESALGSGNGYETTMKDVTSKFLTNGGSGFSNVNVTTARATLAIKSFTGELPASQEPQNPPTIPVGDQNMSGNSGINYGGAQVAYIDNTGQVQFINSGDAYVYNWAYDPASPPAQLVDLIANITLKENADGTGADVLWPTIIEEGTEILFNPNPYYDSNFAGDENYLEDKFVRFSYRFKFEDNEYSLMAPFTQIAFIPKQDGYFTYVKEVGGIQGRDDQTASYRSSVVSFMENKVDDIKLRVPLPFAKNEISDKLKIKELEILYKESDGLAVKVIDTIDIQEITAGTGTEKFFAYDYISKKPIKTLPQDQLTRVYDKIPVRAFAQEIASNRVVYGNFQNKHTPPASLDYNVGVSSKYIFNLQDGTLTITNTATTISPTPIAISADTGTILVGSFVEGTGVPAGTQILSVVESGGVITDVTLSDNVSLTAGEILIVTPIGNNTENVSIVEYPNSTVKQNRTYQVGIVLSDRYGRSSTVILSSNNSSENVSGVGVFGGDTIYSSYLSEAIQQNPWPGNSLKVLFNSVISSPKNIPLGIPGLYNGNADSPDYNPLGWYSYKIVVKQTEQEYYNIYLPGIMASYPTDTILELGRTSHTVLINDNINKIPRDLSELGPEQRQFRSSVQLFARVENLLPTPANYQFEPGENLKFPADVTDQYYPGRKTHTVSTVSTVADLFNYNPSSPPTPNNFPQFYLLESNPLVARISTDRQIGQIATTNYVTQGGTPDEESLFIIPGATTTVPDLLLNERTVGADDPFIIHFYKAQVQTYNAPTPGPFDVIIGDAVTSPNCEIPEGTFVLNITITQSGALADIFNISLSNTVTLVSGGVLNFSRGEGSAPNFTGTPQIPGLQYLSVYETDPVESLLDIFWETSTTGLISSLNNLILNDTGGSAGLSEINTNPWLESLVSGGNIFAADVFFQNSFGGAFDSSQIVTNSITIDSAINNNNIDVQLSNPFFQVVESGNGGFNIITTQAYYSYVYFFAEPGNERLFTFTVHADVVVNGVQSVAGPFSFGPIGPGNVAPTLTRVVPQNGATINADRNTTTALATLHGINGANNTTFRVIMTHSISSVEDTISNNDVTAAGYFQLDTSVIGPTAPLQPDTLRAQLKMVLGNIPASNFEVTIVSSDEGGIPVQVQTVYQIDLTISPAEVQTGQFTCTDQGTGSPNTVGFLYIEITGSTTIGQDGHYVWITQSGIGAIENNNIVTIDRTNAYTAVTSTCNPVYPYYSALSLAGALDIYQDSQSCSDCELNPTGSISSLTDVANSGNYTYEIV